MSHTAIMPESSSICPDGSGTAWTVKVFPESEKSPPE
jgi:hypothetical protein